MNVNAANERKWGTKRTATIKWEIGARSLLFWCSSVTVPKAKTRKTYGQREGVDQRWVKIKCHARQ